MAGSTSAAPALMYGLFKPECFDKFFVQHAYFDVACLTFLLSKLLSYGIICGAVLVKVPQILKIVKSRSTKGLAPSMYVLENIGYLIVVTYNLRQGYAFSTFGENIFLLLQGMIICTLLVFADKVRDNGRLGALVIGAPLFAAFAAYLAFWCSLDHLSWFQTGSIGLFAASRLPQIWSNYSSGSTGQLAVITVGLNSIGSLARVFTTLTEVKDQLVLVGMITSATLNATMLTQMIWYWNAKSTATTTNGSSKNKKKNKKTTKPEAPVVDFDEWLAEEPVKANKNKKQKKKAKKQE